MNHRMFRGIAFLAIVAMALASCGVFKGIDPVTIRIDDRVLAGRTVMPYDLDLEADSYHLVVTGTSGQALTHEFELDLDADTPSTSLDLLPGGWSFVAHVINVDLDEVGIGTQTADVVVGVTTEDVVIACLPNTGTGYFAMEMGWVPAVIANPQVVVNLTPFQGAAIPITPISIVAETATGSNDAVEQGWYIGTATLSDAGVLSAGSAEAIRLAAGAHTFWDMFFNVQALETVVEIDVGYYPGSPLTLTSNPAEGAVDLFTGYNQTITVSCSDNDAPLTYVWYENGVAVELSDDPSITLDGDLYDLDRNYYLAAIAYQWNGTKATRAGSLQYVCKNVGEVPVDAFKVQGTFVAGTGGITTYFCASPDGSGTFAYYDADSPTAGSHTYVLDPLDAGRYVVSIQRGGADHYYKAPGESTTVLAEAARFTFPHSGDFIDLNFGTIQ